MVQSLPGGTETSKMRSHLMTTILSAIVPEGRGESVSVKSGFQNSAFVVPLIEMPCSRSGNSACTEIQDVLYNASCASSYV